MLLEFNPDVQRWDPQPVRLRVGETGSYYTPDVLVSFYPKGKERKPRLVLYEVKYRDELRKKWAELKPRLKASRGITPSLTVTSRIKTITQSLLVKGSRPRNPVPLGAATRVTQTPPASLVDEHG